MVIILMVMGQTLLRGGKSKEDEDEEPQVSVFEGCAEEETQTKAISWNHQKGRGDTEACDLSKQHVPSKVGGTPFNLKDLQMVLWFKRESCTSSGLSQVLL